MIATDVGLLNDHQIPWRDNSQRVGWEMEVSIDLSAHPKFPASAISSIEAVDAVAFRQAASKLGDRHPAMRMFVDVFL